MLYFVSDIAWVLILNDNIPHTALSASIVNISNAVLLSLITGFWFVYVELSQGETYIGVFKNRMLVMLPAVVETAVQLILFIFFPKTMLDDGNEMTIVYYIVFLIVPAMYIVVSAVRSFRRAMLKENFAVRTQYLVCAFYPVIITIFGILQTLWLAAPLFCFGCAIMMLYAYIINLNDQVSIDELTRLNNRTQLKKYVASESLKQGSDKQSRYVLMIDLNKFKHINDQYGHVEGDNALKRTADALKTACGGNPLRTFSARFGGDEFLIIGSVKSHDEADELKDAINTTIERVNKDGVWPFRLSISSGYILSDHESKKPLSEYIKDADNLMYETKKKLHAEQGDQR